jgi:hypothetical protein
MILEVEVIDGEVGGFIHPEAVVIDYGEEGPVARGVDRGKEACEFVLGQIFGQGAHAMHWMRRCRLGLGAAGPHALLAGLLHVLAHQLGQLEHRDGRFPAKDGCQRGIRVDLTLIPGIL